VGAALLETLVLIQMEGMEALVAVERQRSEEVVDLEA
jgi:hypothetical protein